MYMSVSFFALLMPTRSCADSFFLFSVADRLSLCLSQPIAAAGVVDDGGHGIGDGVRGGGGLDVLCWCRWRC